MEKEREEKIKELMKIWNCSREEAQEILFEEEIEQGFRENSFCDNTGYCMGTSCKSYCKCRG